MLGRELGICTRDVHTSRVDNPVIVHKSTVDRIGFDNFMELQLVWTRYLPFDPMWFFG